MLRKEKKKTHTPGFARAAVGQMFCYLQLNASLTKYTQQVTQDQDSAPAPGAKLPTFNPSCALHQPVTLGRSLPVPVRHL